MDIYSQILEIVRFGIVVLIGGGLAYIFYPLLISGNGSHNFSAEQPQRQIKISIPNPGFDVIVGKSVQNSSSSHKTPDPREIIKVAVANPLKTTLQLRIWLQEKDHFNTE
ncbi:MAG: hypothetical protein GY786_05315 [Proteobacteria bacterium]|nr:hypothetical protein [Pseudomonadota bacterium]